ncbi:MAG TPA: PspC domain-containing protein [Pedobacter sp.]|nr:PspC domain-containing protein [Pedobacter sp.]
MKKTLHINIGNSIILIEEDAYEMLTTYLIEVKQYFAKNADDLEIVTDIENRIAEMFGEMLVQQQKKVISIADVQSVIKQMGSVKDFESSEEENGGEYKKDNLPFSSVKKLYRDTDQAMIAGVCSGLAHYLDFDIRWIRLTALFTVLIGGAGILAYIILWIMIPRAETKTEKMYMKGQETNLRGFANIHLEPLMEQSKGFLAEFFDVIGNFATGTGKAIFKVIAIGIIAASSFFLISLFIAMIALLGIWDADVANYFPFSIVNDEYFTPLTVSAFVVGAIPLLALILFSARVAFSKREVNKTLSFVLLIVWLAGMAPLIIYITKISSEFKEGAEFSQVTELKPYTTYTLTVDRTRFFSKQDSMSYSIDAENYRGKKILTDIDDEFKAPRDTRLWLEKSENGKISLTENFRSRGRNFETALKNAQNIHYDFLQTDSVINFNPMVQLEKNVRWRGQEVELTLKIPVGTTVIISEEFRRYMSGNIYWDCEHEDRKGFYELLMTDDGIKCKYEATGRKSE